jgi:hypothetical protein
MLVVEVKEVNHRDSQVLQVVTEVGVLVVYTLVQLDQLQLLTVFQELNIQVVAEVVLLEVVQVLVQETVVQVVQVSLF